MTDSTPLLPGQAGEPSEPDSFLPGETGPEALLPGGLGGPAELGLASVSEADRDLLLDLAAGFLEPQEVEALEERLESQPALAELHAQLLTEQEVLAGALAPETYEAPPAGLSERVVVALAEQAFAPSSDSSPASGVAPAGGPRVLAGRSQASSPKIGRWVLLLAAVLTAGALLALQKSPEDTRRTPQEVMNRQVRTSELLALGMLPEAPQ